MIAAQLDRNTVVNLIEVDSLDVLPDLIKGNGACIGDTWDGSAFIRPTMVRSVPQVVPMLNAHLVIIRAGKMPALHELVAALPEPERFEADAYLKLAQTCQRNNKWVILMGAQLGYDEEGLDQLFIAANSIDP
jgi:hypothetical protein